MQYYSQCGQDRFLEENIFKGYKNGIFVDVGAHDGITINNTLYFEKNNNWSGINVEPIKYIYDKLVVNRNKCININCAVDNIISQKQFIINNGYSEMLSGLIEHYDPRHMERLKKEEKQYNSTSEIINVNTLTLEHIFDKFNINNVNYLSIDVEGAEMAVIQSINFNKVFIDVIGFENNFNDDITKKIIEYLQNNNYLILKIDTDVFMIHKDSKFRNQ